MKEDELKELDAKLVQLKEKDERNQIIEQQEAIKSDLESYLSKATLIIETLQEKENTEAEIHQLRSIYQSKLQEFNDEKVLLQNKIKEEKQVLNTRIKTLEEKKKQKKEEFESDYQSLQDEYLKEQKKVIINREKYEQDLIKLQEERETEKQK